MAKLLVHLATGPENPTRAALAMLVARTAASEGHDVSVFLAGDAVQLLVQRLRPPRTGLEPAASRSTWPRCAQAGVGIYASGMSSKARGVEAEALGAEPAPPQKLVELATAAETTLTY